MRKLVLTLLSIPVLAMGLSNPPSSVRDSGNSDSAVAVWLAENGLPFTAVPFFKSLLATGRLNDKSEKALQEVFSTIGTSQFELFQDQILRGSKSSYLKFINAKKLFKKGNWSDSISVANSIDEDHAMYPFALSLKGAALTFSGKTQDAGRVLKECVSESNRWSKSASSANVKRRYFVNKEVCTAALARSIFTEKKYDDANSLYLDVQKSSPIWPEILFEEAWNSYYQKDYNRTLGKLVTYKAPVFTHVYNPEISVLSALTYYRLCLYNDASKEIEQFYAKEQPLANFLDGILRSMGRDFKKFYFLAKNHIEEKRLSTSHGELGVILNDIVRDPAFRELYDNFHRGKDELSKVKTVSDRALRNELLKALKESLILQRDLAGAYVRRKLLMVNDQLKSALEGMSYLKLEMINQRKEAIYNSNATDSDKRGELKNLTITDKQYFWGFNGEFWADELGDYVFSLKSECR